MPFVVSHMPFDRLRVNEINIMAYTVRGEPFGGAQDRPAEPRHRRVGRQSRLRRPLET
ncbi:MAG: hypothetical protein WBC55_03145 [Dehalococcoidia bacterium]